MALLLANLKNVFLKYGVIKIVARHIFDYI